MNEQAVVPGLLFKFLLGFLMKFSNPFTYAVIEDAPEVCEGIMERMNSFPLWKCCGIAHDIVSARELIQFNLPSLLFMDWDIKGGSTFDLLELISSEESYHPFIIYFTAFQNDEPLIPVQIHNSFQVDKYLIKPIWKELSENLGTFVRLAEKKAIRIPFHTFRTEGNGFVQVQLDDIIYVAVFDPDKRTKSIFLKSKETLIVKMTLDEVEEIFRSAGIACIRPNRKFSIVNPKYIKSYHRPEIGMMYTNHTLTVSSDNLAEFERFRLLNL
ncbi:MAG TPA: LytTR family transcriptional regulator DNA-binding domain-containing protein [Chitinophagaceae bacterium]|nr:LytTR family transcriptional regulator DNA-binding domain-containing protein [Chitinophagaceae bacterium]